MEQNRKEYQGIRAIEAFEYENAEVNLLQLLRKMTDYS